MITVTRYCRCPGTAPENLSQAKVPQPNTNSSSTLLTELGEVNFKANMMMLMRPMDELKEGNSCWINEVANFHSERQDAVDGRLPPSVRRHRE